MNTKKIIVGLPSFNEEDSISLVTQKVDHGLQRISEPADCLIINIDSQSTDRTKEIFQETPTVCAKQQFTNPSPIRGKGSNLRLLWQLALANEARAVVTVDADLKTITSDWIEKLLQPIIDGRCDYIAPLYSRNRFEGSTTNHLAVPIIWNCFNAPLRQPIGGEFACNRKIIDYFLRQAFPPEAGRYGIDIFMTMHALGGGFQVGEVFLGRKFHKPSFPKIMPMFEQVAETALNLSSFYSQTDSNNYVDLGETGYCGIDAESVFPGQVEIDKLVEAAKSDYWRFHIYFCHYLQELSGEINKLMLESDAEIPMEYWVRILGAFLNRQTEQTPPNQPSPGWLLARLFICRVRSFWRQINDLPPGEVERLIEEQKMALSQKSRKE